MAHRPFVPSRTIEESALEDMLVEHAAALRDYVDRRIPARLRAIISADDVIQEVWIGAFRNRMLFTPAGPDAFDRWLRSIANRRIVDAMRTATRAKRGGTEAPVHAGQHRRTSVNDLFEAVRSPQRTPSRDCASREATRALEAALAQLTGDRREAIRLYYLEGASRAEIAERLGKSQAAVNSLLFHGLREMRRRLRSAGRFFSDARSTDGSLEAADS